MKLLRSVLTELIALFVDDGSLVLAVLAWVVGMTVCLRLQLLGPAWEAVLLSLGIAGLLAENVLRHARAHARRAPPEA